MAEGFVAPLLWAQEEEATTAPGPRHANVGQQPYCTWHDLSKLSAIGAGTTWAPSNAHCAVSAVIVLLVLFSGHLRSELWERMRVGPEANPTSFHQPFHCLPLSAHFDQDSKMFLRALLAEILPSNPTNLCSLKVSEGATTKEICLGVKKYDVSKYYGKMPMQIASEICWQT